MDKAAIYLRQSQDKHDDRLAVLRQRQACLNLCTAKGWSPVEYEDNDTSATTGEFRENYQRMLTDIESGAITAVVVWDLDRLHRRPIELEHFMALADRHRLALATVTGDVDLSTDNGRLFARIKGAVGMAEVERKSARQKAATSQIAEEGRSWWPGRMFGFDADRKENGKWWTYDRDTKQHNPIRLEPTEAAAVKAAYQAVLNGSSLGRIAKQWNDAGFTTPAKSKRTDDGRERKGVPWRGSSVRTLLLAARNAGLRVHHGKIVGEGNWPAIVDEETWRSVVAELNDPSRGGRAPRGRKRLLSGIAVCGVCGHRLGSGITHTSKTLTYVCKHCGKVSRAAEPIDKLVIEAAVQKLSGRDAIELTRREHIDGDELRMRREGLRAQQAELGEKYGEGELSLAAFTAADRKLTETITEIDRQLTDTSKAHIFDGLIGAPDVRAVFRDLDLDQQRAAIGALMTVTVNPVGKGSRQVQRDRDLVIHIH
jgi:DNA invertase Pin-like site-specific DNA recombinase